MTMLTKLTKWLYSNAARQKTKQAGLWARLEVECLEPRITPSYTLSTLATFNGSNGADLLAGLIEDSSGNLFGTTYSGGANNDGTVYEVAHGSGTVTTLATFNGTNGAQPIASLIEDSGGNLFGTTFYGGTNDIGTVFEVAQGSGTITTLASFKGTIANHPSNGSLIEDSSGNLFGTTAYSGYGGTVFELAQGSGTITTLASFSNGANPAGGLIEDGTGNFFGTTETSSTDDLGTVFELAQGSSTITTLATFNGTNGFHPVDGLVEDSGGNLSGRYCL